MQRQLKVVTIIAALALGLAACAQKQQTASQEAQQAASQAPSQAASPATSAATSTSPPAPATSPAPASAAAQTAESTAPAAPPPAQVETYTIPAGRTISIHLDSAVSSASATAGSSFSGTLANSLFVSHHRVIPAGSVVSGHVTHAVSSGRLNRPAELAVTLDSVTPRGGSPIQIATNTLRESGNSHKKRNEVAIGGGAGVGALLGALAGKGKGAAIGGLIGAAAGTAGAAATGKKEITLPAEALLRFQLTSPLTITRRVGGDSGRQ
jgi:hypothetical protein